MRFFAFVSAARDEGHVTFAKARCTCREAALAFGLVRVRFLEIVENDRAVVRGIAESDMPVGAVHVVASSAKVAYEDDNER